MRSVAAVLSPKRSLAVLAATAVLGAVVAVPLVASPQAAAGVTQTPGLVSGQTLSGMINHQGPTYANAFGAWRGAPLTAITTYTGVSTWDDITAMGSVAYWSGINVHHVWSMPLIPPDGSSTLEAAAAGSYDSKYVTVAQKLVAGGDGAATMRLGWEFTGDWFGWNGLKDPAAFAGAFRHAVTSMRSVPGAHFTFDWDPALEQADPTPMWPGDSYVDIVSADTYDNSWSGSYSSTDHVAVWNGLMTGKFGWNWLVAFAAAHGHKRLAIPEWGVRYMCDGHGGGDDPYFVDMIHQFVATHDVAFETYFDANDNNCSRFMIRSGDFPKAAAEYQKLFSTPQQSPPSTPPPVVTTTPPPVVTTTPPPVVTTTPPPVGPTVAPAAPPVVVPPSTGPKLMLSYSPDRSWPAVLNKQSLDHNVYIYYPSASGVKKVAFSIDGRAYHTENSPAWDLAGTAITGANAFQPKTLTAGAHSLLATVTMSNGSVVKQTVTFYVPASVSRVSSIKAHAARL